MRTESASFFITGGTLHHDAPSYVERQADRDLLDGLLKGEFCYVLTSRQMGKSSLMVRTAVKLREQGVNVVALDLTAIGQNLTPEQWYDGLVTRMARQLRLEDELEEFWLGNGRLGPCQRFFAVIRDVVLLRRPGPLVIFVDEIDTVRSLRFSTDEFFAAIRECYNRRVEDPELNRVAICLLGVATPSDLIRDTRTTPFNIGRRIELHDFTEAEAAPLARGLYRGKPQPDGSPGTPNPGVVQDTGTEVLLEAILFWTGGHPYLTQRFCRAIAEDMHAMDEEGVDGVCEELFLSHRARERDDNLLFVRERLLRSEVDVVSLLELYGKVWSGKDVADEETSPLVSVLRLAGIVAVEGGFLRNRNRIYSKVFDSAWIRTHMPDAELRRQRAAFYRGVLRTTAVAAVVVAALTITVVTAESQRRKARLALAESHFSQAKALRVSGTIGQRFNSLDALDKARLYHPSASALRDEALAALTLPDLREIPHGLGGHPATGLMEWSPDLKVVALAGPNGDIALRHERDDQVRAILPGMGVPVKRLRFGPKEGLLLAEYGGPSENQVVVWNWCEARRLFALTHGFSRDAVDFSIDGKRLALGHPDGRVTVLSLPAGEIVSELEMKLDSGAARAPQAVRLDPTGDLLAVCSQDDQYVEIWNLGVTQRVAHLYHPDLVHDVSWHPRGQLLAAACGDSYVYLWRTNDFKNAKLEDATKLAGHEGRVTSVAFNHRGTLLASLGNDETVRLWIPATGRQMAGVMAGESFDRLRFSTDDRRLLASSQANPQIRAWETAGGELLLLQLQTGRGANVRTIDFSPDTRWLLVTDRRRISLWEAKTGWELGAIPLANAHAAWFGADGRHVVASSDSGLFRWPLVQTGGPEAPHLEPGPVQQMRRIPAGSGGTRRWQWVGKTNSQSMLTALDELGMMALSRDRHQAAIMHKDSVLIVPMESPDPVELGTNAIGAYYPYLALHPDCAWLAAKAADSSELHLWNLPDAAQGLPAVVPSGNYFGFSPDGRWLAKCWEGEFLFYRIGDWEEAVFAIPRKRAWEQHAPLAFSQDGRVVAVAASRYLSQLFKVPESHQAAPELIATLESPDRLPLEMLAFSPDGQKLAAATDGQVVLLWDLALLREGLAALHLEGAWPEYP